MIGKVTSYTCPMTTGNINKLGLTNAQVEDFCKTGCSYYCDIAFKVRFVRQIREAVENGSKKLSQQSQ